jgi:hypothetical protein
MKKQERSLNLDLYKRIVNRIAHHRLPSVTYFICGLEGDSVETTASTLAFLSKMPTTIGISMYYAVPSLPGFTDMAVFDQLPPFLCAGSSAYRWFKNGLEAETMITAFRLSRYINASRSGKSDELNVALVGKIAKEKSLYTWVKRKGKKVLHRVQQVDPELQRIFFASAGASPLPYRV